MSKVVTPIYELEYRGSVHRFLEFESDVVTEFEELKAKAVAKGWELYVEGTRPEQSHVQVAMYCKPK